MEKYRRYNLIVGWGVFLIALVVYLMTIEPTASFWDCGEFIATAFKMEVGHPPGAPLFMVLGRFFTLFAGGDVMKVPVTVNVLSAIASAFTILFLFWTLTHLVKKFFDPEEVNKPANLVAIFGSALVGSLAYTFTDSFWFSAVEAEVYSTSSLFTAVVFWAILKWENVADQPGANRWIILIAYLMGLSIGVHLLNLLTIPAIIFVFYFRKYKPSVKGVIGSLAVAVALLGLVMYVFIPGLTAVAAKFELMFVNGFGMPFNSGVIVYVLLLFGAMIFGIYYTHKKGKVLWNTIILGLFVVVIGYSSYAIIVIRSAANTPLDESNPDTVFSLLSYLNREQYGDNPLVYGAFFNSRPSGVEQKKPSYYKGEDDYYPVDKNREYVYDKDMKGFFPRMWSTQARHANEYIYWARMNESELYDVRRDEQGNPVLNQYGEYSYDRSKPMAIPSFTENLRFFFRYQIGYMYLRYFMWNFSGRQNDIQGQGELTKGNWISGIKFIDQARLGPQSNQPDVVVDNKGRNKYYMLPLLLGLIGAWYNYKKHNQYFWVITLLFVLTGLAIVVYLNQYPIQPRERDYAFAGSFYAFAIWIGIGVAALIDWLSK
ncbi:MAG: glycosyltransferase family 117 protein, partial [Bacteroidales bacterium]